MNYLAIFIGGGLGSLCRFALSKLNPSYTYFPIGTFIANIIACIILGFVVAGLANKSDISQLWKPLIAIGFCGGFSTFSTFSFEALLLIQSNQIVWAAAYVFGSILFSFLALAIGFYLAKLI